MTYTFIPILIMLIVALVMGAVFLVLNWFIGKHQRNPSKLAPYESGVPLLDTNRKRVNVRFYQIAMHLLPKRGDKPEWQHTQDYWTEKDTFPATDLDDTVFVYE